MTSSLFYTILGYVITLGGLGALGVYSVILYRRGIKILNNTLPSTPVDEI